MIMPQPAKRGTLWFLVLLSLLHGVIDLTSGALIVLLPPLREQYSLSYAMVGNIMLFSSLTSSFTQPFFGLLSDRSEKRWLLMASLLLSGLGFAVIGWMPSYALILVAVVIAALGSASFHPEGAHAAFHLAGERRAQAMAIYSVGGNLGYAMGPFYGMLLIALWGGPQGTIYAMILPLLLAIWMMRLLPQWQQLEQTSSPARRVRREDLPANNWRGTVTLTLLVIVRSMIHVGMVTYIGFYWIDVLGNASGTAPYVQGMYMIAGVFGTLLGAPLADRFGTKRMLIGSFVLLLPLQILLPFLSGWVLLVTLFAAGFVVVSTFAITLVMTQEYMPRALGFASGINLGLAFGMGGVGALILGIVADHWGVVTSLFTVAAMVPITIALALLLPPIKPLEARELVVKTAAND